jgi:hypothetical protein
MSQLINFKLSVELPMEAERLAPVEAMNNGVEWPLIPAAIFGHFAFHACQRSANLFEFVIASML